MKYFPYKRPLFIVTLCYVLFLLLFPSRRTDLPALEPYLNSSVTVKGAVAALPSNGAVTRTVLKVSEINGDKIKTKISLYVPSDFPVNLRETLEAQGFLKEPYGPDIEGSFNWKKFLHNKNIFSELRADDVKLIKKAPLFFRLTNRLRADMLGMFEEHFDKESAVLFSGIILGEKQGLPRETHRAFNDAGAMHLLVASGANVAFVALIVHFLCSFFGVNRKARLPLALLFAGVYTVLAGMDPPLIRAYLMTVAAGAGLMLKRNSGALHGLALAAFIILLFSPKSLYDDSCIMSFLATFIIILSSGYLKIPAAWPASLRYAAQIFFITLCVQLVLVPVYTNVFFRLSLSAVLANVLLVPLAEICMALGFLLYAVKLTFIAPLFKLIWALAYCAIWFFKALAALFSSFYFSAVEVPALGWGAIAVFYVSLFLVFLVKKKYSFIPAVVLVIFPFAATTVKKDFLSLLNKNGENAAALRSGGRTIVFTDGFEEETLRKFILAKGSKSAALCLGMEKYAFCKTHKKPFADFWPGEEIFLKNIKIETSWGLMPKRGGTWVNAGYSGTEKDNVSYSFIYKKEKLTLGGGQNFIAAPGRVFWNRRGASADYSKER